MPELNLDALDALCAAATPGPWVGYTADDIGAWTVYDGQWSVATATAYDHDQPMSDEPGARGPGYIDPDANALFIAASREAVPALIAEVRRLRERIPLIAAEAKQKQRDAIIRDALTVVDSWVGVDHKVAQALGQLVERIASLPLTDTEEES